MVYLSWLVMLLGLARLVDQKLLVSHVDLFSEHLICFIPTIIQLLLWFMIMVLMIS